MAQISQTQASYYGASSGHGAYQFTSLRDIINAFLVIYVGEDKLISKIAGAKEKLEILKEFEPEKKIL